LETSFRHNNITTNTKHNWENYITKICNGIN